MAELTGSRADVYSFSVMCSVILSRDEPFQDVQRADQYKEICNGKRPALPGNIPKELELVIMKGWATDTNLRLSFIGICTTLERIRHSVLRNHSLGLNLKQSSPIFLDPKSNAYIERMLEIRSRVRKHDCYSPNEEEWFNGDESVMASTSYAEIKHKLSRGASVPNLAQVPFHGFGRHLFSSWPVQVLKSAEEKSLEKVQSASQSPRAPGAQHKALVFWSLRMESGQRKLKWRIRTFLPAPWGPPFFVFCAFLGVRMTNFGQLAIGRTENQRSTLGGADA